MKELKTQVLKLLGEEGRPEGSFVTRRSKRAEGVADFMYEMDFDHENEKREIKSLKIKE